MFKIYFVILFLAFEINVHGQEFVVSNDSVVVKIKIEKHDDILGSLKIIVLNSSKSSIFLGKDTTFNSLCFANNDSGMFIFSVGGSYPFSYDVNSGSRVLELIQIKSNDSLVLSLRDLSSALKTKKLSICDFMKAQKTFIIDYIKMSKPKIGFRYLTWEKFALYKERLSCRIPKF